MNHKKIVAFDLDGTLLDTAPDFLIAVNTLQERHNTNKSSFKDIRSRVSEGALALTKFALGIEDKEPKLLMLKEELLEIYWDCCLEKTSLFPGIAELLEELNNNSIDWGIVTNKPLKFSEKIVQNKLSQFNPSFLICPDHTNSRKPSHKGLHLACKITNAKPSNAFFIGDHRIDIEAGKNAGMKTIAVGYGYVPLNESEKEWEADFCVMEASEIKNHLKKESWL